jgi:hypothetical protein
MSSTVFQGFILPFERSKEGAELFPWLAECFFGRRGIVGGNGLLPQGKFSDRSNGCLALFGKDFRPVPLILAPITCFPPPLNKGVKTGTVADVTVQ